MKKLLFLCGIVVTVALQAQNIHVPGKLFTNPEGTTNEQPGKGLQS